MHCCTISRMASRLTRVVQSFLCRQRFKRLVKQLQEEKRLAEQEAERIEREREEREAKERDECRRRQLEKERKEADKRRLASIQQHAVTFLQSILSNATSTALHTLTMLKEAENLPDMDDADIESEIAKTNPIQKPPLPPQPSARRASSTSLARLEAQNEVTVSHVIKILTEEEIREYPANMGPAINATEFERLPLNLMDISQLPDGVLPLCRYRNILPNPPTRVLLPSLKIKGIPVEHATFINANWVRDWDGSVRYIATQGPKSNTVESFWRMIWEHSSPLIVMATSLFENGREKCFRYWPEYSGIKGEELASNVMHLECGMIVEIEEVERYRDYVMTFIRLQWHDQEKFVRHMHLNNWPDYGVPKSTRSLLHCIDVIRDVLSRAPSTNPMVVHCSAGIGRTGIILSVLIGIKSFLKLGQLHMPAILRSLRCDRGGMVQTFEQYEFAYK